MAFDNVVDPTSCNPYTTASGDRKRACPKANLVDIQAKILRSLMLSLLSLILKITIKFFFMKALMKSGKLTM